MTLIKLLCDVLVAWLLADFGAGVFHWFEDRYLDEGPTTTLWHGIASENALHHRKPTAMCLYSWWENIRTAAAVTWPIAAILCLAGAPTWIWLTIFFLALGNLIHRFSHEPKRKLAKWIRLMQWTGLFISHEQHFKHHYWDDGNRVDPKWNAARAYCPMTNWLNPILDRIGFWILVERTIGLIFGAKPIKNLQGK